MGNDSELNILIKAKNEASKVLQQVQNDAKGFGGGISSAMTAARGSSMALLGGVTAVGAGFAAFGVSSFKAATESEDALAQLNAVLKSTHGAANLTTKDLTDQATALQKVTKFSDEAVMATQSMLLTFTEIKGPVLQGATQAALDMAQALGMDGTQAAMQLGKALNDPTTGMTKLQRVGVTFTDSQKQAAAAMVAAGNTAGAQNLILKELQKEFGGSAEAAGDTFSGQLTILKNTFGDLQEAVGFAIMGALQPLVNVFKNLVNSISEAGGILPYLTNLFKTHQQQIAMVAGAIMVALVPALVALAAGIWAAVAPILPFLAVGALLGFMINNLAQRMGGWTPLIDTVRNALVGIWNVVAPILIPALQALFNTIVTQLWPALVRLWQTVAPVLIPALKVLAVIVGGLIVANLYIAINVIRIFISVLSAIIGVASAVLRAIGSAVMGIIHFFQSAYNTVRSIWSAVPGFFRGVVSGLGGAFGGVASTITAPFRAAFNAIAGLWNNTVGRLSFKAPSWVPGLGGKGFSMPKIPTLAVGGIATGPTLAAIGEGGQPEAVVPLNKIGQFIRNVQGAGGDVGGGGPVEVHFHGPVDLNSEAAVDRMFDRLERMSQLARLGRPV